MDGPEGVFGEGICAQAVLVGDHDELEVGVLADEVEVAEYTLDELQLLKGVNLLVGGLLDEGAVAVDKEDTLHGFTIYGFTIHYSLFTLNSLRSCSCMSMEPYI